LAKIINTLFNSNRSALQANIHKPGPAAPLYAQNGPKQQKSNGKHKIHVFCKVHLKHACDPGLIKGHPVADAVAKVLKEHVGEVHKVLNELLADQALVLVLQDLQDGKFTVAAGKFKVVARKFTVSGNGLQSREDCSHTATHLRQVPVEDGEAVVEGNALRVHWGALATLRQDAVPREGKPASKH
jgi:hypothetical protein